MVFLDAFFLITVGISLFLAIATGANDETFAAVVGSRKLSLNQAVLIGAVLAIAGALLFGKNVSTTIGKDISNLDLATEEQVVLAILVAMIITLILASFFGLPISSTHAMVGAVTLLSLWIQGVSAVNWTVVLTVLFSWIASPILGFMGSYLFMKLEMKWIKRSVRGLTDVERTSAWLANFLLVAVTITAVSRAGNDVSNAVAPIFPAFENEGLPLVPFLLGGIGLAIGLIVLGRRVLRTLGNDIVELSPEAAFAVQAATAIVTFTAAQLGIPVSGTQILVASFIGVGVASAAPLNMKVIKRIVVSALMTPFVSGFLTITLYLFISLWL